MHTFMLIKKKYAVPDIMKLSFSVGLLYRVFFCPSIIRTERHKRSARGPRKQPPFKRGKSR